VVARCRKIFGQKRVGHSGTLDPDATGVLLVGLGRVTRLLRFLTDLQKSYTGELVLGTATSTLDASGEVVGEWDMSAVTLAERLGWPLTRDAALCLYTGLVTDTGRFQYTNTTPEVFALAQELSGFELPIADVTRQLFECHRFSYLQMVATCLARAELDTDRRFVAAWITLEDLDRHDCTVDEAEGLIDAPKAAGPGPNP